MLQVQELHPQPARTLPVLDLDLAGDRLREEAPWRLHGYAAATLVRERDLRVVLIELRAGAHMPEHRTVARVTIHALRGRVRLLLADRAVTLVAGQVLVLDGNVAHDVHADVDSALLLTIAWRGAAAPDEGWSLL